MKQNKFTVLDFSESQLVALISGESGTHIPEQVTYLARYAKRLGIRTIVVEHHYIDRHFIDEYASYYSRMLDPPVSSAKRLHFFSHSFTEDQFHKKLRLSLRSTKDRKRVEASLVSPAKGSRLPGYAGFCSVRPLTSVPIGRTIVARWEDAVDVHRDIWAVNEHFVHLANLRLSVEGLAFQQQDAAVGACATAALWSALVRVARQDGMRAPTPAEISDVAVARIARQGPRRLLAANTGLTVQQLCDSTRAFGFTPEVFNPYVRPEMFVASLHTYLLSGIPVVLALRGGGIGHAVTAAGFQISTSEHPRLQTSVPVQSAKLDKLYVHDDRIGPYARAHIQPFAHPEIGEGLSFSIEFDGKEEVWIVDTAIAPVYPKLRLKASSLIELAGAENPLVETLVGDPKKTPALRVDFRYQRAGDYLTQLAGRVSDPIVASQFVQEVVLPRWCGVVRWYLGEQELVEFIYDTTDVLRDVRIQAKELRRGVVCLSPPHFKNVSTLAKYLEVPSA